MAPTRLSVISDPYVDWLIVFSLAGNKEDSNVLKCGAPTHCKSQKVWRMSQAVRKFLSSGSERRFSFRASPCCVRSLKRLRFFFKEKNTNTKDIKQGCNHFLPGERGAEWGLYRG